MFDTIGTVIGVAEKADLLDEDGNLPRVGRVLMADAIGTLAGTGTIVVSAGGICKSSGNTVSVIQDQQPEEKDRQSLVYAPDDGGAVTDCRAGGNK